jgi:hypothetical protein
LSDRVTAAVVVPSYTLSMPVAVTVIGRAMMIPAVLIARVTA